MVKTASRSSIKRPFGFDIKVVLGILLLVRAVRLRDARTSFGSASRKPNYPTHKWTLEIALEGLRFFFHQLVGLRVPAGRAFIPRLSPSRIAHMTLSCSNGWTKHPTRIFRERSRLQALACKAQCTASKDPRRMRLGSFLSGAAGTRTGPP